MVIGEVRPRADVPGDRPIRCPEGRTDGEDPGGTPIGALEAEFGFEAAPGRRRQRQRFPPPGLVLRMNHLHPTSPRRNLAVPSHEGGESLIGVGALLLAIHHPQEGRDRVRHRTDPGAAGPLSTRPLVRRGGGLTGFREAGAIERCAGQRAQQLKPKGDLGRERSGGLAGDENDAKGRPEFGQRNGHRRLDPQAPGALDVHARVPVGILREHQAAFDKREARQTRLDRKTQPRAVQCSGGGGTPEDGAATAPRFRFQHGGPVGTSNLEGGGRDRVSQGTRLFLHGEIVLEPRQDGEGVDVCLDHAATIPRDGVAMPSPARHDAQGIGGMGGPLEGADQPPVRCSSRSSRRSRSARSL